MNLQPRPSGRRVRHGQAFSLDLLVALTVLTAVIGAAALIESQTATSARAHIDAHNHAILLAQQFPSGAADHCTTYVNYNSGLALNTSCASFTAACRDQYQYTRIQYPANPALFPNVVITKGCPAPVVRTA